MEAGRAVMSSGSRAKARSEIPFAGKYNNACRATWVLPGRLLGGGWWFCGWLRNVHRCEEALLFHGHRCAHKITPLSF